MRIQSPLSNLCEVLNQVKASAKQYDATLRKNEAATRAVLIDPVLRALGWDTANTYMVEVEKTLSQTRVDYALFDNNGQVRVIVEAKPLGENLAQQSVLMSLVTYAFTFRLQDIFLTDGLIWQHFTDFHPGNLAPTRIINFAEDNFVDCAAYLVHRLDAAKFWPESQTIDALAQQIAQLESVVSTMQQELAQMQSGRAGRKAVSGSGNGRIVKPAKATFLAAASPPAYVGFEELPDLTGKKPVSFRLPDGSEIPVRTWKDILREACKFALTHHASLPIPLPDRAGKKITLLSTNRPPQGIS